MGKKIRVLLTGYSGFLGRYIAKALLNEGYSLVIILHKHTILRKELETNIEVIWGSIDSQDTIRHALDNVDYVVHSAWAFSSPNEERPTLNERATRLLFSESIRNNVKKFAFISSVAVYGMKAKSNSIINEISPLAKGKDLSFIYPSEKVNIEKIIKKFNRRNTSLAIFRPGPIFDENKGPVKSVIKFGHINIGIGIGNGRNRMAFIHARDVADAVVLWLKNGKDSTIYNVVPSKHLSSKEWIRAWGRKNNINLKPIFIPGTIIRLLAFGVNVLKKILRRQSNSDVKYALACAKRDVVYSNRVLKESLGWKEKSTLEYINNY